MKLEQCYTMLHGNYQEAKQRLMSDRLVERFILKFPSDPSMAELRAAVEAGNHEDAFRAVHTLKGVAANLAFTELQQAASELTEQLRGSQEPASPPLVEQVERCYKTVIDTISAYQSEL